MGDGTPLEGDWFSDAVKIKLGKGNMIKFWRDKWYGMDKFCDLFPALYRDCEIKEAVVEEMGWWDGGVWQWSWEWTRNLLPNEEYNLLYLQELLLPAEPIAEVDDSWVWSFDISKKFTVSSCYRWLTDRFAAADGVDSNAAVFAAVWPKLWRVDAPSKVLIFAWRALRNILATREALYSRGILQAATDRCCVFCFEENETVSHLFVTCRVTRLVWQQVLVWLGVSLDEEDNLVAHFEAFGKLAKGKKIKRVKHLIWLAVIWVVWLTRNKVVFQCEVASTTTMISGIKDCAWGWFKARKGRNCGVGWFDWYNCPMGCLYSL